MEDITEAESVADSDSDNQYDVPGQLTVWSPGSTDTPVETVESVPENYVLIEIATPLQDKTYILPVYDFECGLHPKPADASCVYLTEQTLEVIFPVSDDTHLVVSRSLKDNTETASLQQEPARDPRAYNDANRNVVWTVPKTDAAVIES